jgi:transposase
MQIYTGLDLSRNRLDWHACSADGTLVGAGAVPPDPDGLTQLVRRLGDANVLAVIEVMNGARFVHDQLELRAWDVRLADPQRSRALAPLACKTDRIDAWVLAELARRDLIPEVWLPDPAVRAERERARFRLHLVKHRTMLKNRIHQTLIAHGHPRSRVGLFTQQGRSLLDRLELPEPWRGTLQASLALIETLDQQTDELERELRRLGADHRYVPLLCTVPGIAWVLAYTIASEIGDITRVQNPRKADRLHRPLPARLPIRRERPARRTHQARARLSALGADRSRPHRSPLQPPPRAHYPLPRPPRRPARIRGRCRHHRPQAHRGDLVDAHPQPALRSGRRPECLTARRSVNGLRHRTQLQSNLIAHTKAR